MKNLFLNLFLIFSLILPLNHNKVNAEPVNFEEIKQDIISSKKLSDDDNFVTQHNDITLRIGTLEFPAIFMYRDEKVPYQGYLIKFNDFLGVEAFVDNINKGCDILYDELLKECKKDLDTCQRDCDARINLILKEKDALQIRLDLQIKKTSDEKVKKYIWTVVGVVVGASAGILTYELVK